MVEPRRLDVERDLKLAENFFQYDEPSVEMTLEDAVTAVGEVERAATVGTFPAQVISGELKLKLGEASFVYF
jgi:hypothetical protein